MGWRFGGPWRFAGMHVFNWRTAYACAKSYEKHKHTPTGKQEDTPEGPLFDLWISHTKFAGIWLVTLGRAGKEQTVTVTEAGLALCARYHELREALLTRATGQGEGALREAAALLRGLSGAYDQAARAAATV